MMWGYSTDGGWTWWMVIVGLMVPALFITGTVLAVSFAVRQINPRTAPGNTARAILEERFARGELDEEEFVRRAGLLSRR